MTTISVNHPDAVLYENSIHNKLSVVFIQSGVVPKLNQSIAFFYINYLCIDKVD